MAKRRVTLSDVYWPAVSSVLWGPDKCVCVSERVNSPLLTPKAVSCALALFWICSLWSVVHGLADSAGVSRGGNACSFCCSRTPFRSRPGCWMLWLFRWFSSDVQCSTSRYYYIVVRFIRTWPYVVIHFILSYIPVVIKWAIWPHRGPCQVSKGPQ